jgi:hypothetical protein
MLRNAQSCTELHYSCLGDWGSGVQISPLRPLQTPVSGCTNPTPPCALCLPGRPIGIGLLRFENGGRREALLVHLPGVVLDHVVRLAREAGRLGVARTWNTRRLLRSSAIADFDARGVSRVDRYCARISVGPWSAGLG